MATALMAKFAGLESIDLSENTNLRLSTAFTMPPGQGALMRRVRLRGCEGQSITEYRKSLHLFKGRQRRDL